MDFLFLNDGAPEVVSEKHVSVKAAAELSGYSSQYLRRLLRNGHLEGIKIGQVWLINIASFERYLRHGQMLCDRRHGPRKTVADGGRSRERIVPNRSSHRAGAAPRYALCPGRVPVCGAWVIRTRRCRKISKH